MCEKCGIVFKDLYDLEDMAEKKKKGEVYLLICRIETDSRNSLKTISALETIGGKIEIDLLHLEAFDKFRSGPFEDEVDAFLALGNDYRFNLGGCLAYNVTKRCLIARCPGAFRKLEYLLYYPASKQIKPLTNLRKLIKEYYPYGPDY